MTATVRLVTGGDGKRWSWLGAFLLNVGGLIREAALVVAAIAAFVYAAFQLWEPAGWIVLGLGLIALDWGRRDKTTGELKPRRATPSSSP